jgi:hypothetical protein
MTSFLKSQVLINTLQLVSNHRVRDNASRLACAQYLILSPLLSSFQDQLRLAS